MEICCGYQKSHLAILYLFRCYPLLHITYLEGNSETTNVLILLAIKIEKSIERYYESKPSILLFTRYLIDLHFKAED